MFKHEGQPTREPPPIPTEFSEQFSHTIPRSDTEVERVQGMIRALMTDQPQMQRQPDAEMASEDLNEEIADILEDGDLFQSDATLHPIAPFPERQPPNSRTINLRQTWEVPSDDTLDR